MKRFLITAGNTREMIDLVRDWGNIFTGGLGLAISKSLCEIGEVDLVTSNQIHLHALSELGENTKIHGYPFRSHADLFAVLENRMQLNKYDGIFMTAAVADYKPDGAFEIVSRENTGGEEKWIVRNVQAGKIKSTHREIAIVGKPTRKIVDCFREPWGHRGLLVKFKLEVGISDDELIEIGRRSRAASSADYLVANTLAMLGGDRAGAFLISDRGEEWIARADLPAKMAAVAREYLNRSA